MAADRLDGTVVRVMSCVSGIAAGYHACIIMHTRGWHAPSAASRMQHACAEGSVMSLDPHASLWLLRCAVVQSSDMMSVKDVQEMLGIPLLGAIPEDEKVRLRARVAASPRITLHAPKQPHSMREGPRWRWPMLCGTAVCACRHTNMS